MMLDFLGEHEAGELVMTAMESVTASGGVRTPDLGGSATTQEVTDAVVQALHTM